MTQNSQDNRLLSLDVFRGFDMMFIMGVEGIIIAVCNLFPGGENALLARNMYHVDWHGLYFMDTIFPTFLFIAGISFPFSYAKQLSRGSTLSMVYRKIFRRAALLLLLGFLYNGLLEGGFDNPRYCSVLGRIGLAWMVAALLYINLSTRQRVLTAALLLTGYWLLVRFVSAPDSAGADPLSLEGNIVGYVDRMLMPGHLYLDIFDPEGLLGIIPATVTAMTGMFTGEFVRSKYQHKVPTMLSAAVIMLAVGMLWSLDFPINKNLWSSSFVLVVGAYSLAMFSLSYWLFDVRKWRRWTLFFQVIGMNSITIYLLQRIVDMGSVSRFFLGSLSKLLPDTSAALLLAIGYVTVSWLVLYFLYTKKVFLKV